LHCGHFEEHNYLVMELLGMNLSELRRRLPPSRQSFSPATTVRLVVQMIQSVAALHNVGYLHRDIKPSNFAIGCSPQRRQQCIMIDFGLARKYRLPNGQIRPARDVAGFRGTARLRVSLDHKFHFDSSLILHAMLRPTLVKVCVASESPES
jgi:tau tubulin kinase